MGRPRIIIGSATCLIVSGWVHSAQSTETEIEVLGKLTLQAQAEHRGPDTIEISGRLSDDAGKPTSGVVTLHQQGQPEAIAQTCDNSPLTEAGKAPVPPSGEFCFLSHSTESHLSLTAEAPHFVSTSQEIGTGKPGYLPAPRFTQAPQSIDIESASPSVVEILAGSGSYVRGVELALRLNCRDSTFEIDRAPLVGSRLERFEFTLPAETAPGNCSLEAETTAPHHPPVAQSRNVLVRAQVALRLKKTENTNDAVIALVEVTTAGGRVREGLIEARTRGAFLVGAPIHEGMARVELDRRTTEYEVDLRFLPAGPSLVPADPLSVSVPVMEVGFQWATLHILLLLGFCGWLGYAWLRPQNAPARAQGSIPPREGVVRAAGRENGPIRCNVADAHTGLPIPSVVIVLFEPGANTQNIIESQESNSQGQIQFMTELKDHPLLQLEAKGDNYMHLRSGVRSSQLSVHLTHRRRAAVQNLVKWAKNQGRPWHQMSPPTPGDVEKTARLASNLPVETWAQEISAVVYGKSEPSESVIVTLQSPRPSASAAAAEAHPSPANEEPRG